MSDVAVTFKLTMSWVCVVLTSHVYIQIGCCGNMICMLITKYILMYYTLLSFAPKVLHKYLKKKILNLTFSSPFAHVHSKFCGVNTLTSLLMWRKIMAASEIIDH